MGDGYMLSKQKGFDKLVADVPGLFEKQHTYREYFRYFGLDREKLQSKLEQLQRPDQIGGRRN